MGTFDSRNAGEPTPAFDQAWVNGVSKSADYYNRQIEGGKSSVANSDLANSSGRVKVRNLTGEDLLRGHYVQLGDYLLAAANAHQHWYEGNLYDSANSGRVAIVEAASKSGSTFTIWARILGKCLAVVNVSDIAHRFAAPVDGEHILESAATGSIEILSNNLVTDTGEQELTVMMGIGGTSGPSGGHDGFIVLIDDDIDPITEADPSDLLEESDIRGEPVTGTADSGDSSTIVLEDGASTEDSFYDEYTITITGGTGSGQTRTIGDYDGGTLTATVDEDWDTAPDNTSTYEITPGYEVVFQDPVPDDNNFDDNHVDNLNLWGFKPTKLTLKQIVSDGDSTTGTADDGDTSTIVLEDGASTVDSFYDDDTIEITGGTGEGQTRTIGDYDGATRTATVDGDWDTPPDNTSEYEITSDADMRQAYTVIDDLGHMDGDDPAPRKIVRYSTKEVWWLDGKGKKVGKYNKSDYPDYDPFAAWPPPEVDDPDTFFKKRYRAQAKYAAGRYWIDDEACKPLKPPKLPDPE